MNPSETPRADAPVQPAMQGRDESTVYCPHCGADGGHYSDYSSGMGDYYVPTECWECEKPFAVEFAMSFTARHLTEDERGEEGYE